MSQEHTPLSPRAMWAWAVALAATAILGSWVFACMAPFVALGVMAAATLPRRQALAVAGLGWVANQLIGYGPLHYPLTGYSVAWGGAIGVAAILAAFVASLVVAPGRASVLRVLAAAVLAFGAYEGALYLFALVEGGLNTFTPAIVLKIALNDGVWLAALAVIHLVLTTSAPRVFGPRPALRLA